MNTIFKEHLRKFLLVFFDDILIYSKNFEQHFEHLESVLCLLRKHSLYAKKSKCSFGGLQEEYLGHFVTGRGVLTDPSKIVAVVEWPVQKAVKQLRGFLSLTGYCRKFIRG